MKIAILGFGLQGKSSYEFYNTPENSITICDMAAVPDLPANVETQIGPDYLKDLDRFDLIVRGPKVHPKAIVTANTEAILHKVTSNTNEFFKQCPTKNIIGVTGTKGKGTTSTLITKMLQNAGYNVLLGGNIGIPPLDLLRANIDTDDWVVLELANYQLIDLIYSPHIAICVMVEPEHLDWHSDVDEYFLAKTELFRHQTAEDISIYYADNENSTHIASVGPGKKIPYFTLPGAVVAGNHIVMDGQPIIRLSELKLLGKHNYQNVCAAITAVWQINQDARGAAEVLREFSGLPFRLEERRKVNDVTYYNDSFASAPPATMAAIEAIAVKKVMIVGGKDRGLGLNDLSETIMASNDQIRKLILIGESAKRLATSLNEVGYTNYVVNESKSMDEIVKAAAQIAQAGDSVVLSPGFPSFDMFKNFDDRGIKFNEAVSSL